MWPMDCVLSMWVNIMTSMYSLYLHGCLKGLHGPRCLLSPKRPLNLITHSLTAYWNWYFPNILTAVPMPPYLRFCLLTEMASNMLLVDTVQRLIKITHSWILPFFDNFISLKNYIFTLSISMWRYHIMFTLNCHYRQLAISLFVR